MSSISLFKKCEKCGKEISISLTKCSQCNTKFKKSNRIKIYLISIFGLIFLYSTITKGLQNHSSILEINKSNDLIIPEIESKFINTVEKYSNDFNELNNELQQSIMRDQRQKYLLENLKKYSVKSWIGTIQKLETNSDGKAILSIRIAPDIEIKTWNNAVSDFESNSLIEKESSVYSSLLSLSEGQKVYFSGHFFPSNKDFIEETSLTIEGSMKKPEFLFKFESVKPIN